MKKTPFHDVGIEYGAQMRELFGYWLPWEYAAGHVAEHLGTRERASLCDLDYMAECTVEGPHAFAFVQHLFTNDFRDLSVGGIRYTAMCQTDGNMVDDGTVWRLDESKFMFVSGDESDFDWVAESSKTFDVEVRNITSEWTTLALQGPRSRDILGKLTEADLDSLRYYHFMNASVSNVECVIDRLGYTGEFGYEFHFHPQHGTRMWRLLMDAGAEYDIVPCGQAALESLRQEAGYLLVGNDHDKRTNPLEAGIGWAVKFTKDDFVGKQALREVLNAGVRRRLVWFRLSDTAVASKGDAVLTGGHQIGEVTSGSDSPTLGRGVAMGYVLPAFAIPGVEYAIRIGDQEHPAVVSVMPLYDPGDVLTKR
jgi:aminomethyltransferase